MQNYYYKMFPSHRSKFPRMALPPHPTKEQRQNEEQKLQEIKTKREQLRKESISINDSIANLKRQEKKEENVLKLKEKQQEKQTLEQQQPQNPEHLNPDNDNSHHIKLWEDHKGKLNSVHEEIKNIQKKIAGGRKRRTKRKTKHKKRKTKHKKRKTKRRKHRRSRRK